MNDPAFADERKWTLDRAREYLHEQGMAGPNWAEECMKPAQKRAILTAFNASKAKLARVPGSFCLYGADFIIDDTLKVWLTEIQIRPALALTGVKRKFLPRMIKEMLHVGLGILERKKKKESLADLSDLLDNWQVIINEAATPAFYYDVEGPDTEKCRYSGPPKEANSVRYVTKKPPPRFNSEGRMMSDEL